MNRYVFLVEDDELLCEVMAYVLRASGDYTVATAADGEEALRTLALGERVPDVILTDLQMPKMCGDGLIARLRQNPKFAAAPIGVISGMARHVPGANIVVHKPITADALLRVVRLLCSAAAEAAGVASLPSSASAQPARVTPPPHAGGAA